METVKNRAMAEDKKTIDMIKKCYYHKTITDRLMIG